VDPVCHRCGNTLRAGEDFCPHCRARDLTVDPTDTAGPQQPAVRFQGDPQNVQWRTAILASLLVAIPVGLLSALTRTSSLFPIGGGFAVIALYRRRSAGFTDGRIGWRVGAILGGASAFLAAAAWAAQLLIERYLLHQGGAIDQVFQAAAQLEVDTIVKWLATQGPQPPEILHEMRGYTNFLLSPDGYAGSQLATVVLMSIGIVLFAAAGGAIAGRLLAMRTRVQRSL
jgi:hypothetical protein